MTRKFLKELLQEMVLKQAPNCTFGGETTRIDLVDATGFPDSGLVQIEDSNRRHLIHYDRKSGNSLVGLTSADDINSESRLSE